MDGAWAGLGRDAWQPARGVLGTGPRRKPAQWQRRRHGNTAQSTGLLTPRPRPTSSPLQGGGAGLLRSACAPAFALSALEASGLLLVSSLAMMLGQGGGDSGSPSINGSERRRHRNAPQLAGAQLCKVSPCLLLAKRLQNFPAQKSQSSLCCCGDCKPKGLRPQSKASGPGPQVWTVSGWEGQHWGQGPELVPSTCSDILSASVLSVERTWVSHACLQGPA